jgi:GMP synthase (glutamine-hydrolysing)
MTGHDWIAVLDFGSQYTQLIARRIREQNVYCEIIRHDTSAKEIADRSPRGVVLSGGPASVLEPGSPQIDPAVFALDIPVLGICYGMQLMALELDGEVQPGNQREFGGARISVVGDAGLFDGISGELDVWMSHGDQVIRMPEGFIAHAKTSNCPVAAMSHPRRNFYGLQFHPEVVHTPRGVEILRSFLFSVCACKADWTMEHFITEQVESIRSRVGDDHVICGLSGGVDSSVTAALIQKAINGRLHCVFVDNGLLRHAEAEAVEEMFGNQFKMDLQVVRAGDLFLERLAGVTDPEEKRKIIGNTFIDVFAEAARSYQDAKFLAQGTLYPDVIESISPIGGPSATIKSHHNVGGLPDDLQFELIEPLRELFKDEVRVLGRELSLGERLVDRQPFPGPGLAVRILGDITAERIELLQQADLRVQEEVRKLPQYREIWQSFAVLLPVQSVGVMGDDRTYENVVAIRAVQSLDGMTADWYRMPYDTLDAISSRIINEVPGINRVVYDISSKPPSTIEWE